MHMIGELAMQLVIRSATADDIPNILSLWIEFIDFHAQRDPHYATVKSGPECMAEYVAKCLESDKHIVLVAEQDGKPVSYLLAESAQRPAAFVCRDYGAIIDLAVAGPCRRCGIGEKMVAEAIRLMKERGVKRIEVSYALANEVSSAFWPKMGFKPYLQRCCLDVGD